MSIYHFNESGHIHTLNGKPLTGTSSVLSVLSKPLTWWASGLAVGHMGWSHPTKPVKLSAAERQERALPYLDKIRNMTPQEYVKLLDEAYRAHTVKLKDSADKGTDLHAELEKWVKGQIRGVPVTPHTQILPFVRWSESNVKRFIASEAHCYSERLWTGGITDTIAELNDGKLSIIDFKSAKAVYISHLIQCGGYAVQVNENGLFLKSGEHSLKLDKPIAAIVVVAFGADPIVPETRYNVGEYIKGFEWAVGLYRLMGLDEKIKEAHK